MSCSACVKHVRYQTTSSTNIAKENKEHRFNFNAADQELGTAVSADHDI